MPHSSFLAKIQEARYRVEAQTVLRMEANRARAGTSFFYYWVNSAPETGTAVFTSAELDRIEALAGRLAEANREQTHSNWVDPIGEAEEFNTALDVLAAADTGRFDLVQEQALGRIFQALHDRSIDTMGDLEQAATALEPFDADLTTLFDHPVAAEDFYRQLRNNPDAANAAAALAYLPNASHRIALVAAAQGDSNAARYSPIRIVGPQTVAQILTLQRAAQAQLDASVVAEDRARHLANLADRLDAASRYPMTVVDPEGRVAPTPGAVTDHISGISLDSHEPVERQGEIARAYRAAATDARDSAQQLADAERHLAQARARLLAGANENPEYAARLADALRHHDTVPTSPTDVRLSDHERWALGRDSDLLADLSAATRVELTPELVGHRLGIQDTITDRHVARENAPQATQDARPIFQALQHAYLAAEGAAQDARSQLVDSLVVAVGNAVVDAQVAGDQHRPPILSEATSLHHAKATRRDIEGRPGNETPLPEWMNQLGAAGLRQPQTGISTPNVGWVDMTTRTAGELAAELVGPSDTPSGMALRREVGQLADWLSTRPPASDVVTGQVVKKHPLRHADLAAPLVAMAAPASLVPLQSSSDFGTVHSAYFGQRTNDPRGAARLAVTASRAADIAAVLELQVVEGTNALGEALGLARGEKQAAPEAYSTPPVTRDALGVADYAAQLRHPGQDPSAIAATNPHQRLFGAMERSDTCVVTFRRRALELGSLLRVPPRSRPKERRRAFQAAQRSAPALRRVTLPPIEASSSITWEYGGHGLTVGLGPPPSFPGRDDDSPPGKARQQPTGPNNLGGPGSGGAEPPRRRPRLRLPGRSTRGGASPRSEHGGPVAATPPAQSAATSGRRGRAGTTGTTGTTGERLAVALAAAKTGMRPPTGIRPPPSDTSDRQAQPSGRPNATSAPTGRRSAAAREALGRPAITQGRPSTGPGNAGGPGASSPGR